MVELRLRDVGDRMLLPEEGAELLARAEAAESCNADADARIAELEAEVDRLRHEIAHPFDAAERDRLAAVPRRVVEWGEKYDYLLTEDAYQELTDICAALTDSEKPSSPQKDGAR